jgi:hypothetical protein
VVDGVTVADEDDVDVGAGAVGLGELSPPEHPVSQVRTEAPGIPRTRARRETRGSMSLPSVDCSSFSL